MPFTSRLPQIACALLALGLAGCYSSYRQPTYNPYGPGVPIYSPQAVPQFGPPVISPTPGFPQGTTPGGGFPPAGGTFPSDNLTPTPDPNFPPSGDGFQPSGGFNSSTPNGTGLVPDDAYYDPENLPPRGTNTFEGNSSPFVPDGASFQRAPAASESVGRRYEPARSEGRLQLAALPGSSASEPYGYDASGYRWLKGLVDYDEEQETWLLVYDVTPDESDDFKGQITLAQSSSLDELNNNDAVLVQGRVDSSLRDPGTLKPQYRVEGIQRL
jgi:hypothetical protein